MKKENCKHPKHFQWHMLLNIIKDAYCFYTQGQNIQNIHII